MHIDTISDVEDEDDDDGFLVDPDPVENDDDDGLQGKFTQATRNSQLHEDREFERWTQEVNRGGMWGRHVRYGTIYSIVIRYIGIS